MGLDQSYDLIKDSKQIDRSAELLESVVSRSAKVKYITLDLTTARDQYAPVNIEFSHKTVWLASATDSATTVSLVPNSQKEGNLNPPITLQQNLAFRFSSPASGAQIYWSAQSGKSVTIFFFVDADVFPGSQLVTIQGGVSIISGSSISSAKLTSAGNAATQAITTAAIVAPQDTSRKKIQIYFDGAVWLGDSSVAVTGRGILWPGGIFEYDNTAALYAVSVSGTVNAYCMYHS